MAARGCSVVATDLDQETAAGHGWVETGQHARQLDDLNDRGLCAPDAFRELVSFRAQDMNAISDDLTDFDFVWSSCAFEHLGSIEHGLAFVTRAMRCLKPGGLAVHTTEFNLSSNGPTVEIPDLSVFRRKDIERLVRSLEHDGHRVWPVNLQPGTGPVDHFVDLPPYRAEPHIKLRLSRFVITSIGLAIERGR
jgi:SAM-dependent methyltransferase